MCETNIKINRQEQSSNKNVKDVTMSL